jgi:hypothetical protein
MTYGVTAPVETGIDQQAAAERLAELITSSWISHAIGAGIEIGLFDALYDGPTAIEELARELDCAPGALRQLVHACEALELCRLDAQGCCVATPMGRLLALRSEGSQQAWARLWCGDLAALWSGLAESIRHGASVRSLRGIPAGFGHLAVDPARADAFNRAMTANTWWVAEAFARLPALVGCRHVVDVGGGHGVLMIALLRRHPTLRGTVFDLEHASAGARQAIDTAGVADRAAFVAGDFFDHVPSGADTYVLKSVLHDWPNEQCAAILACCRAAISSAGRLFVVERVSNLPLGPTAGDRAWARSDLNMLVAHGAQERTELDYDTLLDEAGFRIIAVHGLAMGLAAIEACTRL